MKTQQVKVNIIQDRNGQPRFIAMEGGKWVEYAPDFGLNGLFSEGGFFDKVGQGISGIFRKKDGKNTFIGDLVSDFNKGLATKMGEELVTVTEPAELPPGINHGGTGQPGRPLSNRLTDDGNRPEENLINWTPILIGGGVLLAGGITWWALSQNSKKAA